MFPPIGEEVIQRHNGEVTVSYEIDKPLTACEVRFLLDELSADLGFCLQPTNVERLTDSHPLDVRDFADQVFRAKGLNPENSDRRLWRQVCDRIHVHFERAE